METAEQHNARPIHGTAPVPSAPSKEHLRVDQHLVAILLNDALRAAQADRIYEYQAQLEEITRLLQE